MSDAVIPKKGQIWQQATGTRCAVSRTVRVEYVWTASPRVSVIPYEMDGRRSSMTLKAFFRVHRFVKDGP